MKKTSALVLAVTILLAGCGGGAKPDPSPTSTNPASPTPTTPPTTSVPTSPSTSPATIGPSIDPNIPAAARAHTPAGAEAFVRYFYAQLNFAWATPKPGLISALSTPACKTCKAIEGTSADLAAKRQHYRGDVFAVKTVASLGEAEVLAVGEQPPGALIDINGSVVKSRTKAEAIKFNVKVAWSPEGWRIDEIQVMK